VRSREGDLNHWIQATGGLLDQNPVDYHVSGTRGIERIPFDCKVAKWQVSRAHVNVWHIRQVGTAWLTSGVYLSPGKESTPC
jgi:hypothetical protein